MCVCAIIATSATQIPNFSPEMSMKSQIQPNLIQTGFIIRADHVVVEKHTRDDITDVIPPKKTQMTQRTEIILLNIYCPGNERKKRKNRKQNSPQLSSYAAFHFTEIFFS